MDFLDTLKVDHQRFLNQVGEIERILREISEPLSPATQHELRDRLQQLIELLSSHDELERKELLPALRRHLPKDDEWLAGMLEIEDEMILKEARQLYELSLGTPSPISVERLRESGARVVRWMRVHVKVEEERLFPRLQDLP